MLVAKIEQIPKDLRLYHVGISLLIEDESRESVSGLYIVEWIYHIALPAGGD